MPSNLTLILEAAHFTTSLSQLDDHRMHFSSKSDSSDPDEITFLPPLHPVSVSLSVSINLDSPSSSSSSLSTSPKPEPLQNKPEVTKETDTEEEEETPTKHTFNDPAPRDLECTICSHPIGTPFWSASSPTSSTTPQVETAVTLPCGHIYGNICIMKWLEKKSIHQDCPDCRRRMVHRGCGHFVVPRVVGRAPPVVGRGEWAGGRGGGWLGCVGGGGGGIGGMVGIGGVAGTGVGGNGEEGLDGECLRCRGCKVVGEIVRAEKERIETEIKVVKGLWEGLRSVFGIGGTPIGLGGRNGGKAVRERVDWRKREFERIWNGAWEVWEREEGTRRW